MDKKRDLVRGRLFWPILWGIVCTMTLSVNVVVADAGIAGQDLKFGMEYDSTAISLDNASNVLVFLTKLRQNFPLDSWAWSVGAVALSFLFFHIHTRSDLKPGKPVVALSAVFSVVQVLGLSICKLDSWAFVSENLYQILLALFCMLGYAAIFFHAVWGAYILLQYFSRYASLQSGENSTFPVFSRHPGTVASALILLGWSPWIFACFPGSVDWDSHTQICQVLGSMEMTTHHTVLSTWVHGWCLLVGRTLGSDNLGVFIYILLQCLFCAWVYGQVVAFCAKLQCPRALQYSIIAFFALVPVWGAFAQSMVKDTLFAAVFTLFIVYTADLLLFPNTYRERPVLYIRYFAAALFPCLLRKNGIIALVPALLSLIFTITRKDVRRLCGLLSVGVVVFYLGFNAFTANVLCIPSGGDNLLLSIPLQQTGRYVTVYPKEITDEEKTTIDAVVDFEKIEESYTPEISDGMMGIYKDPSTQEISSYFKTWFSMFLKHPSCYFQALQANSYGYYTIAESESPFEYYMYINRPSMDWKGLDIHYCDESGVARYLLFQWALFFKRIPLLGLLTNRGFVFWGILVLMAWMIRRRIRVILPLAVCLFIYWLTLIASPVNDLLRYFLPILASVPVFAAIAVSGEKISKKNTSELLIFSK